MYQLNEAEIQHLEAMWNEELSDEDLAVLQQRLSEDKLFKQAAMRWKRTITEGFQPTDEEKNSALILKQNLQKLEIKLSDKTSTSQNRIRPIYSWLAAAAAVILLLIWLIPWNTNESNLAKTYFQPITRFEANLGDERSPGELAYDEGRYSTAQELLQAEAIRDRDTLLLFYAGIAAIKNQQATVAIANLEVALSAQELALYQDDFKWYLALAYLQIGNIKSARLLLSELLKNNGKYNNQASKLLDEFE